MNKIKEKKKISVKGLIVTLILSIITAFSIYDLANLLNYRIYWDNKTLFMAQLTTIIMFVAIKALTKIELYKQVRK